MKKLLTGILTLFMLVGVVFACACGSSSWEKPTLVDGGAVLSEGGFVLETENYLYYINGSADYDEDNDFGSPIKGSLMAVTKTSLKSGDLKTEIIVPKLFVAQDLNAGLYIYDGYVYYGTPSTDKNSSGDIACDELTFCKTKLDGTSTEKFFTIESLSYEYRIAEKGGEVYIVYYDEAEEEIISYNTSTGDKIVVASVESAVQGRYETLGGYKFMDGENGVSVVFVSTVYSEDYFEEKAELASYTRAEAAYNYVYAYSVGDGKAAGAEFYGKRILDGTEKELIYSLIYTTGEYLFYTQKTPYSDEEKMAASINDIANAQVLNSNSEYLTDETIIVSLEEAYIIDSDNTTVYKVSLTGDVKKREIVCSSSTVTSLMTVFGDDLYYTNSENYIARIKISESGAEEVKVSGGTVDATWYKPQIISFDGKNFIFYLDNSTAGGSYVHYVDLDGEVKEEENDDETISYYLDNAKFIGIMKEEDYANPTNDAIDKIESVLEYTVDENGKFTVESYKKAKTLFDELKTEHPNSVEYVDQTRLDKLALTEQAIKLGEMYYKLKDVTKTNKADYQAAYDAAKAYRAELLEESQENYENTRDCLTEELKYYYQEAAKIFDPTVE